MTEYSERATGNIGDQSWTGLNFFHGFEHSVSLLTAHSAAIDRLNVFPVPDGDTGTNMLLTMQAAVEVLASRRSGLVSEAAAAAYDGAFHGGCGNSGVLLAQIIRGISDGLQGLDTMNAANLSCCLQKGYERAYDALTDPVEGTILTVARHAASAAVEVAEGGANSVEQVLSAAVIAAKQAVEDSPKQLDVLKEAGVVDAGGQGLYIILEGLLKYSRGEDITDVTAIDRVEPVFATYAGDHIGDEQGYCTQFMVQGTDLDVPTMRQFLVDVTDSTLVVGDADKVRVHCHTDTPGDVLNYAIKYGHLSNISIDNMQLQQNAQLGALETLREDSSAVPTNIVAISPGSGFTDIFRGFGAVVVAGGPTMNPSTSQILEAIDRCPGDQVVVLPNNSNVIMAARQAAEASSREIRVLETLSVPQGVSAAMAFNSTYSFESNWASMGIAVRELTVMEVSRATRSAVVGGVEVGVGQYIGFLDNNLASAADTQADVICRLLMEAVDIQEDFITIYRGVDTTEDAADNVRGVVQAALPDAEIDMSFGGQEHYDYIISFE
jgi:hypothetical protein